jgi:hypothetical protein
MVYDFESSATILVLVALIAVYLYILLSPNQPHLPSHPRNFVIPADTAESFSAFIKGKSEWKYTDDFNRMNYSSPDQPWRNAHDDFFLFEGGGEGTLSCFTWFIIFNDRANDRSFAVAQIPLTWIPRTLNQLNRLFLLLASTAALTGC